jgi:hypothetical protein
MGTGIVSLRLFQRKLDSFDKDEFIFWRPYKMNSLVKYEGKIYQSNSCNNIGNYPPTSEKWLEVA